MIDTRVIWILEQPIMAADFFPPLHYACSIIRATTTNEWRARRP